MDTAGKSIPLVPLTAGLDALLESGLYSDLKIYCNDGTVFNVHKMVVCAQSESFKSAVDQCSTSHPTTLTLENYDPEAVKALIEYLYRFNYTVVHENDRAALFLFHIKACAIGEAYGIRALRDLARDRAKIVFENSSTLKDLNIPLAIKTIYDMDVATDSGLRDLVVELSKANIEELLEMGAFSEVMDEVGRFGNDLVRALVKKSQSMDLPMLSKTTPFARWPRPPIPAPMQGVFDKQKASLPISNASDVSAQAHTQGAGGTTQELFHGAFGKPNANSSAGTLKPMPLFENVVISGFSPSHKTRSVTKFSIPLFQPYTALEQNDRVHYQSITFQQPWKDHSFEELRLSDYLTPKTLVPGSDDNPTKPGDVHGDAPGDDAGKDHPSAPGGPYGISGGAFGAAHDTSSGANQASSGTSSVSSGFIPKTSSSTNSASSGTTGGASGTGSTSFSATPASPGTTGGTCGAGPSAYSNANGLSSGISGSPFARVPRPYNSTNGAASVSGNTVSSPGPATPNKPPHSGIGSADMNANNSKPSSPATVSSTTANVGGASFKLGDKKKKREWVGGRLKWTYNQP